MRTTEAKYARLGTRLLGTIGVLVVASLGSATASLAATCPNQTIREQQGSTYLPDCRGYELASPVLKNGQEVEPKGVEVVQLPFRASDTGAAVAYEATGGLPGSASAGLYTQYLARGGALGSLWQNLSLNPDNTFAPLTYPGPSAAGEFEYYAPNLSCGVMSTRLPLAIHAGEPTPQLPPGETAEEGARNIYEWDAADDSYHLVTNVKPENLAEITQFSSNVYTVAGASAGCARIIFESEHRFKGAPVNTLYEWNGSGLEVASRVPDGKGGEVDVEVVPVLRGERNSTFNEISNDGSRVFFTASAAAGVDAGKRAIFVRQGGTTTEVSAPQGGTALEDTGAKFQAASSDGERVFFTANYGLAKTSSVGTPPVTLCQLGNGTGCDLYEYNVETKSLTDLSADNEAETGDTQGANVRGVLGISEEGDYVYFSASGQLVPGAGTTQAKNEETEVENEKGEKVNSLANGSANVYVYHAGLSYVSTIGATEAGRAASAIEFEREVDAISSGGTGHGMTSLVARVSPSGSHLLFATRLKVKEVGGTEYDNEDQNVPGQLDWEQYQYSLASGTVTCVSCNPNRSIRPVQAPGTVTGPNGPFKEVRNGAIRRNLSDSGRVVFDSFAPLLSPATNRTANVVDAYEWEPGGVGDCPSGAPAGCVSLLDSGTDPFPTYVEDASIDGEHAYISTHEALAPQDKDGLRDLYDVRVDGGIFDAPAPPACLGEDCQGPPGGGLGGSPHASESGAGGGNPPLVTPPGTGTTPGEQGVKGFTKRVVKGSSVTVTVTAPGAGRISASGKGLKTAKMSVAKAGSYKLKVALTAKEKKLLSGKRKHKRGVTLKVRISFAPTTGKASAISATVTFK